MLRGAREVALDECIDLCLVRVVHIGRGDDVIRKDTLIGITVRSKGCTGGEEGLFIVLVTLHLLILQNPKREYFLTPKTVTFYTTTRPHISELFV